MADEKDIIVEFLKGKSASKSKFYFKDFTELFPDKGPREVKKILTRLVNEEVLEFWNGILARADKIDKQALLEEKLGHALPISYEDWLKDCHYEKLDAKLTRWLYQQERGFVESLKDVTLEEIAHQRIDEFTTPLKKYIL